MRKIIDLSGMDRGELEQYACQQTERADSLAVEVEKYRELFRLSQAQRFAPGSEKTPADDRQLNIFNEAEALTDGSVPEPSAASACPPVRKVPRRSKGTKEAQLEGIERKTTEFVLSGDDPACPACGGPLHVIRKIKHSEIEIIPAKVIVHNRLQYVYGCRRCEKEGTGQAIVKAEAPKPLLNNSLLSPSFGAWLLTRKYLARDTLYQLERELHMQGVRLRRQTMSNWALLMGERFLKPVYEGLREELMGVDVINADETTLNVIHEEGRDAHNSYMWLFRSGEGCPEKPIVLFRYGPSRKGSVAEEFLAGYWGRYIQCDGYDGYDCLEGRLIRVGCLAHVRRYYHDVLKSSPGDALRVRAVAGKAQEYCNELFRLDAMAAGALEAGTPGWEGFKEREIRPKLEELIRFAERELAGCPPDTLLYKALNYTVSQQERLLNYLRNPGIRISNNVSEREIRPFVMGRKAWMFCNASRGAETSATVYSIVQTALANGLDPYLYIFEILEHSRGKKVLDAAGARKLMPWTAEIQEKCALKKE